jgi:hypothetical protein
MDLRPGFLATTSIFAIHQALPPMQVSQFARVMMAAARELGIPAR